MRLPLTWSGFFMKTTYTTKVSVIQGKLVMIEIYSNADGKYLTSYDFPLEQTQFYLEKQLPGKKWYTLQSLLDIVEAIDPYVKITRKNGER